MFNLIRVIASCMVGAFVYIVFGVIAAGILLGVASLIERCVLRFKYWRYKHGK